MKLVALAFLLAAVLGAQTPTILNLTSGSILATIDYSQSASPKVTGSIGYLAPVNSSGTVQYSFAKIIPVAQHNAKGALTGYVFQTQTQADVWQRLPWVIGKGKAHETSFAVCAGAGVALTNGGANGALNTCGVVDVRLGAHIAITVPIYGQYVTGANSVGAGWSLQPSVGIRYSIKAQ